MAACGTAIQIRFRKIHPFATATVLRRIAGFARFAFAVFIEATTIETI
jgi:hypothetical protein